jgi:hypothetical protein
MSRSDSEATNLIFDESFPSSRALQEDIGDLQETYQSNTLVKGP